MLSRLSRVVALPPPPLGASTNSTAEPPELTAKNLLAVNDDGVSVKPRNVVLPSAPSLPATP